MKRFKSRLKCIVGSTSIYWDSNSFEPDQDRLIIGPDLDTNCLTPYGIPKNNFSKKIFLKISADDKNREKLPNHANS